MLGKTFRKMPKTGKNNKKKCDSKNSRKQRYERDLMFMVPCIIVKIV